MTASASSPVAPAMMSRPRGASVSQPPTCSRNTSTVEGRPVPAAWSAACASPWVRGRRKGPSFPVGLGEPLAPGAGSSPRGSRKNSRAPTIAKAATTIPMISQTRPVFFGFGSMGAQRSSGVGSLIMRLQRSHGLPGAVAADPAAFLEPAELVARAPHRALDEEQPDELFANVIACREAEEARGCSCHARGSSA